jgi:hypothetical protein
MTQAYDLRYAAERADQVYSGPMDDRSYQIMSTFVDITGGRHLWSTKTVNGQNPFTNFSANFPDLETMQDDLNYLNGKWPGQQIEINGAWAWDTGEQATDGEGEILYPLPDNAWELMPPEVNATSNADLVDVCVTLGQAPRKFT